jgi:hypothetical protein
MRSTFLLLSLLCFLAPVWGQSQFVFEPKAEAETDIAYVHILFKTESLDISGYRLRTTFAPDDPVRLAPNSYTLLKVSEDYLGFFSNAPRQTKPLIMDLEPGKHYFLRFTRIPFNVNVDHLTEGEFEMELFFNDIDREPKRTYELGMPGS